MWIEQRWLRIQYVQLCKVTIGNNHSAQVSQTRSWIKLIDMWDIFDINTYENLFTRPNSKMGEKVKIRYRWFTLTKKSLTHRQNRGCLTERKEHLLRSVHKRQLKIMHGSFYLQKGCFIAAALPPLDHQFVVTNGREQYTPFFSSCAHSTRHVHAINVHTLLR